MGKGGSIFSLLTLAPRVTPALLLTLTGPRMGTSSCPILGTMRSFTVSGNRVGMGRGTLGWVLVVCVEVPGWEGMRENMWGAPGGGAVRWEVEMGMESEL